jgi:hypothetical protein
MEKAKPTKDAKKPSAKETKPAKAEPKKLDKAEVKDVQGGSFTGGLIISS